MTRTVLSAPDWCFQRSERRLFGPDSSDRQRRQTRWNEGCPRPRSIDGL